MITIRPKHNNLVVEPFALGEVSKGGLLIPQVAKASTPYRYAKVLAIGPGRYTATGQLVPVDNKVGDIVAYAKNQGVPFPLDDENGVEKEVLMINDQFLLGTVEGLPEPSRLTGLDGRLLQMQPASRAPSDGADQQQDRIARAHREGIIDTAGNTLDLMQSMDDAEAQS